MKKKYCLPIMRSKSDEVITTILANMSEYSFFEVWLDYVDDVDDDFVKQLGKLLGEKLIVLFRRQNSESIRMTLEKRIQTMSLLANSEVFIDIDIVNQREDLEYLKTSRLRVKTIVSYHNYKKTPESNQLNEIVTVMSTHEPSIYKIATLCATETDALRLLQLLLELKRKKVKCIVLGMGQMGRITRIFGTLWGNEMIFAPLRLTEQSAPGQLTRHQLEVIFHELNN